MITTNQSVQICKMTEEHLRAVSKIDRRSYTLPWHEGAFETELTNRCARYLVALVDDVVVGVGGMQVVTDEAHLTTLAVDPEHRGKRFGERLLHGLVVEMLRSGVTRATLEVRERNIAAQNLYAKYGFTKCAVRKNYYSDNYENAVVMWVKDMRDEEYLSNLRNRERDLFCVN